MSELVGSLFRRRHLVKGLGISPSAEPLKRVLGAHDLILIGLGNIVGGGIYILFGVAVHTAGPAVILSFLATGLAATCSALCYAEFAGRIPEAGSAYVFTYLEAGEFLAWHVAWAMLLEMCTGAAAVSVGWSNYTRSFLKGLGVEVPWFLWEIPFGGYFKLDLMSIAFVLFLTSVVAMGISESRWLNHLATSAKLGALVLVIVFSFLHADVHNWADFTPNGNTGIIRAAATVMFAYTGFEIVAQCAEETQNPKRSLPIGIVGSVVGSTLIYGLVATSVTLMVPWDQIDLKAPLALAFTKTQPWLVSTISAAAVLGLFAIGLGNLLAGSRLLMTLGRDGLLPGGFSLVNQSTQTPIIATVLFGSFAVLQTLLFSYEFLAEMVSVGTMFAFTMVCIDLVLTRRADEANPMLVSGLLFAFVVSCTSACLAWQRSLPMVVCFFAILAGGFALYVCTQSKQPAWAEDHFTVPFGSFVGLCGVAMNILMSTTLEAALEWNIVWFAVGWVIYFSFGRFNSKIASPEGTPLAVAP
jgi:APA family basic amino acid/polyamine antiporter